MGQLPQLGAGQDQQVLGDGQVVDIHDPEVGVVIAQIQHRRNIARVAVLEGHDAVGRIPALHRIEHFVPRREAHGLGVGEKGFQGNVGKGALHALIGGTVLAQHLGLVVLRYIHHVLDMIAVIGAQGRVLNAGLGLIQHHLFPRGVEDRQTVGLFVFGNGQHRRHPPLKQRGQLGVHRVDLAAGFVQCVHGSTSFRSRF